MFCASCGGSVQNVFAFCPSCGQSLPSRGSDELLQDPNDMIKKVNTPSNSRKRNAIPSSGLMKERLPTYEHFASEKSKERQGHFKPKGSKKVKMTEATITIGLMEYDRDNLKPVRGSSLPLKVKTNASYDEVLEAALQKRKAFDRKFSAERRGFVLAYPDSRLAKQIPGTKDEFILCNYKDWLGNPYSRLTLYLSPVEKKEEFDTSAVHVIPEPGNDDWFDFDYDGVELDSTATRSDSPSSEVSPCTEKTQMAHSFMTTDFV
jgi:hypothetical protein